MLQFKRPEIAAKYNCLVEKDIIIHTAGYNGPLSNINAAGAEKLLKAKAPYLELKPVADPAVAGSIKELSTAVKKLEREYKNLDAESNEAKTKLSEMNSKKEQLQQLEESLKQENK
jgi:hypothetical protein